MKLIRIMPKVLKLSDSLSINLVMHSNYKSKSLAIHQPELFPYIGYIQKLSYVNKFVFLDDVCFEKNNFQNRNKIIINNSPKWLTIPIHFSNGQIIKDIKVVDNLWKDKMIKTFKLAYKKANFFEFAYETLIKYIYEVHSEYLIDYTMSWISFLIDYLDIETQIFFSSDLNINSKKTYRLIDISRAVGAKCYISGLGAKDYLNEKLFTDIKLEYFQPKVIEYKQFSSRVFLNNMSSLDIISNVDRDQFSRFLNLFKQSDD